jgi:hypothetical protein
VSVVYSALFSTNPNLPSNGLAHTPAHICAKIACELERVRENSGAQFARATQVFLECRRTCTNECDIY